MCHEVTSSNPHVPASLHTVGFVFWSIACCVCGDVDGVVPRGDVSFDLYTSPSADVSNVVVSSDYWRVLWGGLVMPPLVRDDLSPCRV